MKKSGCLLLLTTLLLSCGADLDIVERNGANSGLNLVFPENNSECTEGISISETQSELVFVWTDENTTGPYIVHLTNSVTSQKQQIVSDSTAFAIRLNRATPYAWYVSKADGSESEVWVFYNEGPGLESFVPFPATSISPVSGATISQNSTSVNLIWDAEDVDGDIVGYDLYFGEDNEPPLLAENIEIKRYNNVPVTAGKTFYWKIVVRDALGNESISSVFSFTVG